MAALFVCLWLGGALYANHYKRLPPAEFAAAVYRNAAGERLQYRLLSPMNPEPGRLYPLVLALHGAGSQGTDNQAQLLSVAPAFTTDDARTRFPCYVLAPQCPPDTFWVPEGMVQPDGFQVQPRPTTPLRLTLSLTAELARTLPVDPDRIYLVGYSRGATGGWDALARAPHFFTAAALVCGTSNPSQAPDIAHIPIWIAHGTRDATIPVGTARAMTKALTHAGGHPSYHEYLSGDHEVGWIALNDHGLLPWLFFQRRDVLAGSR